MEITLHPIGLIHTPFTTIAGTPLHTARSAAVGEVELYPEFEPGLKSLDGLSHIFLIYVFHQPHAELSLEVTPFIDNQTHGIFATRFPVRPNPIGISVVRLQQVNGPRLTVEGVDMLDGSPLLDIKPYVPEFDIHTVTKTGWYATRTRP